LAIIVDFHFRLNNNVATELEGNEMKNLKKLRRDSGLSQHALAKAAGLHRWRISHAELGIADLSADEAESIRKVLASELQKKSRSLAALTAP
jgi:predicted transcriptional regulator